MTAYSASDVPVRGGGLRAGRWGADGPPVLAVHGITANHTAWWPVARLLVAAGRTVVAPDLRGRGRSGGLPGPWGMPTHAEDLAALLDGLGIERADVVGHSMGGFVAVEFAARYPDRVGRLVLVDGGVPFRRPPDVGRDDWLAETLGPAAARLSMTFASPEAYRDFFRAHPALGPIWGDDVARYVDYDLVDGRSSVRYDAVAQDFGDLDEDGPVAAAWERIDRPVPLLRAPRGLMAEPPGLYPPHVLDAFAATRPHLDVREVPDVDHYGITLAPAGAAAVAAVLTEGP